MARYIALPAARRRHGALAEISWPHRRITCGRRGVGGELSVRRPAPHLDDEHYGIDAEAIFISVISRPSTTAIMPLLDGRRRPRRTVAHHRPMRSGEAARRAALRSRHTRPKMATEYVPRYSRATTGVSAVMASSAAPSPARACLQVAWATRRGASCEVSLPLQRRGQRERGASCQGRSRTPARGFGRGSPLPRRSTEQIEVLPRRRGGLGRHLTRDASSRGIIGENRWRGRSGCGGRRMISRAVVGSAGFCRRPADGSPARDADGLL